MFSSYVIGSVMLRFIDIFYCEGNKPDLNWKSIDAWTNSIKANFFCRSSLVQGRIVYIDLYRTLRKNSKNYKYFEF